MSDHPGSNVPTEAELQRCVQLLEAFVEDRGLLASVDPDLRRRLLAAAGRVSRPERDEQRAMAKKLRRNDREVIRAADNELLDATGIRSLRRAPVFVTPEQRERTTSVGALGTLRTSRKCYCCKEEFHEVHGFYDQMCPSCADLNWKKRQQTADLRGRTALVTGARVKIGYQAAIMLLRAGARVLVTTRFPHDAARRYSEESDFEQWKGRLSVYGLDLRHTPSVERFAQHVLSRESRLDFVVHNACQTVRRPSGFYQHLLEGEAKSVGELPGAQSVVLTGHDELVQSVREESVKGLTASALMSQTVFAPDDRIVPSRMEIFPEGKLDQDQQQIDLRGINSWRLKFDEVSTIELLEVQLVNAVAPFVLSARLKPLMLRSGARDMHVVNVSAMEGQFYREHKTDKHPHTNMAKAALNMLTRTSASDLVNDGIHMNSVDTGWVTDEDPAAIASRKVEEHGFHPPLDIVDGAARICDPVFDGINRGEHAWGMFFKDYKPTPW